MKKKIWFSAIALGLPVVGVIAGACGNNNSQTKKPETKEDNSPSGNVVITQNDRIKTFYDSVNTNTSGLTLQNKQTVDSSVIASSIKATDVDSLSKVNSLLTTNDKILNLDPSLKGFSLKFTLASKTDGTDFTAATPVDDNAGELTIKLVVTDGINFYDKDGNVSKNEADAGVNIAIDGFKKVPRPLAQQEQDVKAFYAKVGTTSGGDVSNTPIGPQTPTEAKKFIDQNIAPHNKDEGLVNAINATFKKQLLNSFFRLQNDVYNFQITGTTAHDDKRTLDISFNITNPSGVVMDLNGKPDQNLKNTDSVVTVTATNLKAPANNQKDLKDAVTVDNNVTGGGFFLAAKDGVTLNDAKTLINNYASLQQKATDIFGQDLAPSLPEGFDVTINNFKEIPTQSGDTPETLQFDYYIYKNIVPK
ncbi:hypothetical protein [[Mycoplasma] testudinis]|uniref:hypothetical protein n=1 Tax=[Mycoplasma] testudinis TaxID=33924 RepID=UPI000488D180|nr:hypothetical protein [[Mycoplasma] testudinis]